MSGHKRTTVSLNELDLQRLLSVEQRLKNVEEDYSRIKERIKQSQEKELISFQSEIAQTHSRIVTSLNDEYLHFEDEILQEIDIVQRNLTQELIEQTQLLQEQIDVYRLDIWDQVVGLINENEEKFEKFLDQKYRDVISGIKEVQEDINSRKSNQQNVAYQTFLVAQEAFRKIIENFPFEKYFPGEQDYLISILQQAELNYQNGFFEACLVSSQTVLFTVEKLKRDIIHKVCHRNSLLSVAKKKINQLHNLCILQRYVNAIGIDGENLDVEIDVDYWSVGKYQKVLNRINSLMMFLDSQSELLDAQDIKELFEKDFIQIKDELEEAIYISRRNVLASQIRFNIASCVIKALEEQGYFIAKGEYDGKDQRCAYKVLLNHLDGSEVMVSITGLPNEIGSSILDLESYDAELRTEHELMQRAKEVAKSLSVYGLYVGKKHNLTSGKESPMLYGITAEEPIHRVSEERLKYGRN